MIEVGSTVYVIRDRWWYDRIGKHLLRGLKGEVLQRTCDGQGELLVVRLPNIGKVLFRIEELEVIE